MLARDRRDPRDFGCQLSYSFIPNYRVSSAAQASAETAVSVHPHVHVLVTDGGFRPDGTFRPLVRFDSQQVERLFRAEVLGLLLDKELISEAVVDNLLSWRQR